MNGLLVCRVSIMLWRGVSIGLYRFVDGCLFGEYDRFLVGIVGIIGVVLF